MQVTWSLSMLLFNLMSRRPQYLLECNPTSWVCTACRSREFSKISLRPSRTNMLLVQGVAHTTLRREGHLAGPFVWGPGFNLVPWTLLKQRAQERSRDRDTRIVHSLVYFWAIVGPDFWQHMFEFSDLDARDYTLSTRRLFRNIDLRYQEQIWNFGTKGLSNNLDQSGFTKKPAKKHIYSF